MTYRSFDWHEQLCSLTYVEEAPSGWQIQQLRADVVFVLSLNRHTALVLLLAANVSNMQPYAAAAPTQHCPC